MDAYKEKLQEFMYTSEKRHHAPIFLAARQAQRKRPGVLGR